MIESQTEVTEHEMDEGWNQGIHFLTEQSSSSSSSVNWDRDVMQEMDNIIEGIERMTGGIMGEFQRITEEAGRITGSLFGFPSFPGDNREERSRSVFSFPVKEEEREVDERDGYEMQEQLYSEFADKVKDV